MEQSNHARASKVPDLSFRGTAEGKRSYDSSGLPMSPRLRKKRSTSNLNLNLASRNQARVRSPEPDNLYDEPSRAAGGFVGGVKARKGSIRETVKRIFGRRSKDFGSGYGRGARGSPPRHTYTYSEPVVLSPPLEVPETYPHENTFDSQAPLDPYIVPSSPPPFGRIQSPSAALFPKSAQLQPLDLGNPFQRKELRRRKTLPSVMLSEREAEAVATVAAALGSIKATLEPGHRSPMPGSRAGSVSHPKRLSRSTDDLRNMQAISAEPQRKRSDEIRYWRASMQQEVPSTDAGVGGDKRKDEPADDPTPLAKTNPFEFRTLSPTMRLENISRQHRRGHSEASSIGLTSMLSTGAETSKELEDRVAKLEAGLQNFQQSLQKLTATRNRRTVIMGGVTTRRASNDMPTMLADTLMDPTRASTYEYEYANSIRPATSPQPDRSQPPSHASSPAPAVPSPPIFPRTSSSRRQTDVRSTTSTIDRTDRSDGSIYTRPQPPATTMTPRPPPSSSQHRRAKSSLDVGTTSPALNNLDSIGTTGSDANTSPQPYTFHSLYQMLADERTARRRLEDQLRGLRLEITELHNQVAANTSPPQPEYLNNRNSYVIGSGGTRNSLSGLGLGNTRLRDILMDVESSPPGTRGGEDDVPRRSALRDSDLSLAMPPAVVSRFSASTGPPATDHESVFASSYETFETPMEGHPHGGMF